METITITKEQIEEIVLTATVKAITHFQGILKPVEEPIKISRSYSITEASKLLGYKDRGYASKLYSKKESKLKKMRNGKFTGASVKAEYERLYGV